jgi:HD-GYP domain-containing protein (c-di-GMP phosphodiesterase class II)
MVMDAFPDKAQPRRQPAVDILMQKVVQGIESYVGQAMAGVPPEVVAGLADLVVREVREFSEGQGNHLYELVKIGLGLSSEKNIDRLLERIVREARHFTNADGGTLYIMEDGRQALDFAIVQNDSLGVCMGGSGEVISWPPVPLRQENKGENHRNVSAHCALTGEPVNISDVYDAEGYDFQGTRDFDASTGYRSRSMLVIPLRDHEDEVIGVLQLLNAKDRETGAVVPFPEHEVGMVMSLASQAAIALTKMRLVRGLENLLDAFVRTIGDAIDEKSPYTAGHVYRVANLTEEIALEVNRSTTGRFASVSFSADEMAEIRMAAWLHDVGKITTPEHLMDKATKLETIFDRIELIRHRVEISRLHDAFSRLENEPCPRREGLAVPVPPAKEKEWQEIINFLDMINLGGEGLPAESIEKVLRLAGITYAMNGIEFPLLAPDEVENLCVPKGTLTAAERKVMNHHVEMSIRMLEGLPFPKKLRNVPVYAGMHHEKLNGTGYPRGLGNGAIPLPARMLALADVLEALTAADRPYKPGKMLSEAMRILEGMVARADLDGELCDLVVESGLVVRFAQGLPARQRDDFFWRGRRYCVSDTR